MRFHTRRLLFTTGGLKGVAYRAATCCSLSFISPYPRARVKARRKDPGGKHVLYTYTRGGSAYFVYPLFIVGSLPLFFCCVLPAPELFATHRLPSYFPFRFSFFFSSLFARRQGLRNMCTYVYSLPRKPPECISFIELRSHIDSRARDRREFIEQFYGRNTAALWKRFLALETTSLSSSSSS